MVNKEATDRFEVSIKEINKARDEIEQLSKMIENLERLETFNNHKKSIYIEASTDQLNTLRKLRIISQPYYRKKRSAKKSNTTNDWLTKRVTSVATSSATGLLVAVFSPTVIAWPILASIIAFMGSEYLHSKQDDGKSANNL